MILFLIDQSSNYFPNYKHQKTVKKVPLSFLELEMMSQNVLFCANNSPNPTDNHLTVM